MIITQAHVRFWMEKHRPAFGKGVYGPKIYVPTIHECIADHDPSTFGASRRSDLSNLMSLLKLSRRNGNVMSVYLQHLYFSPHTDSGRRRWVLRFLNKLHRRGLV